MPLLQADYVPPRFLKGGHAQTIAPRFMRRPPWLPFEKEFLELEDGDFFSIDRLFASGGRERPSRRAAILSHGLEGHSRSVYMRSMAMALLRRGWDVIARNFRSCGEMNRLPRIYHSGETGDLATVIHYALTAGYRRLALVGFSMGGNQVLKYLGEKAGKIPTEVIAGAGISVPCDLTSSSRRLAAGENRLYMIYFMRSLRRKIREKQARFPELFSLEGLNAIKNFKEFDDRYTAPLGGFKNAEEYWTKSSSKPYLSAITTPTLLINARNDPFLSPSCYPEKEAQANPALFLMMPDSGGHVGFPWSSGQPYWLENTVVDFFEKNLAG